VRPSSSRSRASTRSPPSTPPPSSSPRPSCLRRRARRRPPGSCRCGPRLPTHPRIDAHPFDREDLVCDHLGGCFSPAPSSSCFTAEASARLVVSAVWPGSVSASCRAGIAGRSRRGLRAGGRGIAGRSRRGLRAGGRAWDCGAFAPGIAGGRADGCREAGAVYNALLIVSRDIYIYTVFIYYTWVHSI
jgi:hypothetical protein